MNNPVPKDSRNKLSDDTYRRCLNAALEYLEKSPSIRNRDIRAIAGIEYDQAITFFNCAVAEKRLARRGHTGGTHYVRYEK